MTKLKYFFIASIFLMSMIMCFSSVNVSAQPVINSVTPQENATGVYPKTVISVNLSETAGDTMNVTIVFVANNYTYNKTLFYNSSQTLTFPGSMLPLTELTTYQFWVNVSNTTYTGNPSGIWVNNSFNFTTGASTRMTDSTFLDSTQIALIAFLVIVLMLALISIVWDIKDNKKFDPNKLIIMLIAVIIFTAILGVI